MHRPNSLQITEARARGMTLVEVLVTLVIMSVGLLGVAALQLTSLRNNYDAYVRSQASMLAADLFDRMRANRGEALAGDYSAALGPFTGTGAIWQADVGAWKRTLAAQLPNGDGSVQAEAFDAAGQVTAVRITIQWNERGDNNPIVFTTLSGI
ncbi:MAG TPA: type IV pilus modification protein PilV [Steroidobacteraceae bacterium]|nr:type IV pilus modification protein PilV [Steroidobacteraceae bacterium]